MNFIESKIDSANQLLAEIHNYIKWQAPLDIEYMSRDEKLKVCCEVMRVTVRITRILGWLMLQKAILDGELSREDCMTDRSPILEGGQCLESSSENDYDLPRRLRELLKKSRILYVQMMRLEEIAVKDPSPPEEIKERSNQGY